MKLYCLKLFISAFDSYWWNLASLLLHAPCAFRTLEWLWEGRACRRHYHLNDYTDTSLYHTYLPPKYLGGIKHFLSNQLGLIHITARTIAVPKSPEKPSLHSHLPCYHYNLVMQAWWDSKMGFESTIFTKKKKKKKLVVFSGSCELERGTCKYFVSFPQNKLWYTCLAVYINQLGGGGGKHAQERLFAQNSNLAPEAEGLHTGGRGTLSSSQPPCFAFRVLWQWPAGRDQHCRRRSCLRWPQSLCLEPLPTGHRLGSANHMLFRLTGWPKLNRFTPHP